MRVLVTGHNGYIGCSLLPLLHAAGHDVVGLDNYLFETCTFGPDVPDVPSLRKDIRDVELADLEGFDAVIHLAAISNDPVGDLNPDATYSINHRASSRLAQPGQGGRRRALPVLVLVQPLRRRAATTSSTRAPASTRSRRTASPSCWSRTTCASWPTTTSARPTCATPRPTASRRACAATSWSTTSRATRSPPARCCSRATAPRGARSCTSRTSAARSWPSSRPRASSSTTSRSTSAAPRRTTRSATSPRSSARSCRTATVTFADGASPDIRNYRVNCDKIAETLPAFQPMWTVRKSVEELYEAYQAQRPGDRRLPVAPLHAHQARRRAAGRGRPRRQPAPPGGLRCLALPRPRPRRGPTSRSSSTAAAAAPTSS